MSLFKQNLSPILYVLLTFESCFLLSFVLESCFLLSSAALLESLGVITYLYPFISVVVPFGILEADVLHIFWFLNSLLFVMFFPVSGLVTSPVKYPRSYNFSTETQSSPLLLVAK